MSYVSYSLAISIPPQTSYLSDVVLVLSCASDMVFDYWVGKLKGKAVAGTCYLTTPVSHPNI